MNLIQVFGRSVRGGVLGLGAAAMLVLVGCAGEAKESARKFAFWPPAPEPPHIQFLRSISSSGDVTSRQTSVDEVLYGKEHATDLPFQRPYGVRIFDGSIYICDAMSGNATVLDLRKKLVRILGRKGQVTLQKPIDIAVAPDGTKYVADTGVGAVVIFDANDRPVGQIASPNLRPVSVAVDGEELFVSDLTGSVVRVYERSTGKELRTIGERGNGPGKLGGSMGLALDKEGNVYVNDVVGCRVHKFTRDGKFLLSFGGVGTGPGKFVRPKHMAVDSTGIVYVVDNAFANVQMFNEQGKLLMFFGDSGSHPGAMDMPTGICVSDTDLDLFADLVHPAFEMQRVVIVTNNYGPNKINIYALGQFKPGKTVADIQQNRAVMNTGLVKLSTPRTPTTNPGAVDATTEPATGPSGPIGPATAPAATEKGG